MAYDYSNDRLYRMVNNPYLADVKFQVGSNGKIFYAHRMLLACASEVLKAALSERSISPHHSYFIVVSDIDPDTFLDVLYFIYCDICDLNKKNVKQLLYAAKKYQLYNLVEKCEQFMIENTNLGEWIQMYFTEQCPKLREFYAKQLCANMEAVFEHPMFLQLNSSQIRSILELHTPQRSKRQLLDVLDRWVEHQPESQRSDVIATRLNLVRKIHEEDKNAMSGKWLPYVSGVILASRNLYLHGMGIYTGVGKFALEKPGNVSVVIDIGCCEETVINKAIPLKLTSEDDEKEKQTQDCHFKPIRLSQGEAIKLTVRIAGISAELRDAWCSNNRNKSMENGNEDIRIVSSENTRFVIPIAYLLYDPVE